MSLPGKERGLKKKYYVYSLSKLLAKLSKTKGNFMSAQFPSKDFLKITLKFFKN